MKVLICNDDGIASEGLNSLAEEFAKDNEVLVVAPEENRSGVSHSISLGKPLRVTKCSNTTNYEAYSTSGFPADCVKIARYIFNYKPDVVLSGINKGHNFGTDIMYSGTIAATYEAAFYGYPAFAFSAFSHGISDFVSYSVYAKKIVNRFLPYVKNSCIINVNFPDSEKKIRGVKFATLGKCVYNDYYEKQNDGTYILKSETDFHKGDDLNSDVVSVFDGYIAITPLLYDRTDRKLLREFMQLGEICIE